jgi:hypothetical protein
MGVVAAGRRPGWGLFTQERVAALGNFLMGLSANERRKTGFRCERRLRVIRVHGVKQRRLAGVVLDAD